MNYMVEDGYTYDKYCDRVGYVDYASVKMRVVTTADNFRLWEKFNPTVSERNDEEVWFNVTLQDLRCDACSTATYEAELMARKIDPEAEIDAVLNIEYL